MKSRASAFLKQMLSVLSHLAKAKTLALKGKTNATKARFALVGLLRNKKLLLPTISHKIHALLGHEHHQKAGGGSKEEDDSKAIVLYNALAAEAAPSNPCHSLLVAEMDDDEDKYPDLTHSLFDEFDNGSESVIDLVRNAREDASEFNLEEEIDHVADVFIKRFHRQMRMQKLESFKRYKEMLDRSV